MCGVVVFCVVEPPDRRCLARKGEGHTLSCSRHFWRHNTFRLMPRRLQLSHSLPTTFSINWPLNDVSRSIESDVVVVEMSWKDCYSNQNMKSKGFGAIWARIDHDYKLIDKCIVSSTKVEKSTFFNWKEEFDMLENIQEIRLKWLASIQKL